MSECLSLLYTAVPVLCRIRICTIGIYYLAELKYCTTARLPHGAWPGHRTPTLAVPTQTANLGLGTWDLGRTTTEQVSTESVTEDSLIALLTVAGLNTKFLRNKEIHQAWSGRLSFGSVIVDHLRIEGTRPNRHHPCTTGRRVRTC